MQGELEEIEQLHVREADVEGSPKVGGETAQGVNIVQGRLENFSSHSQPQTESAVRYQSESRGAELYH